MDLLNAVVWLATTVFIYSAAIWVYKRSSKAWFFQALFHPLITSSTLIICLLYLSKTSISDYQSYTILLSLLLGPATVALALPLYNQCRLLMAMNWRVLIPIIFAGIVSPLLAWTCLKLLDTPLNLQMTVLVKSITTPLAMDAANAIGGLSALAAVLVISSGIIGAVFGPSLFTLLKIKNEAAQGIALGSVSHAIGTARAISISEVCAAFSTLALCVNGIATAIILPLLFS